MNTKHLQLCLTITNLSSQSGPLEYRAIHIRLRKKASDLIPRDRNTSRYPEISSTAPRYFSNRGCSSTAAKQICTVGQLIKLLLWLEDRRANLLLQWTVRGYRQSPCSPESHGVASQ